MAYEIVDTYPIVAGETFRKNYALLPDDAADGPVDPTGMVATAIFAETRESTEATLTLTSLGGGLVFTAGDATTPTNLALEVTSAQTVALLEAWTRRRGVMTLNLTSPDTSDRYLVYATISMTRPPG